MNRRTLTRRTLVSGLALTAVGSAAAFGAASRGAGSSSLAADVGEMVMLGVAGDTRGSAANRDLAAHLASGRVGGVFLRKMNVGAREDFLGLVKALSPQGASPLIAIDHEGGAVQRLVAQHGFTRLPRARDVALNYSPAEAKALYAGAAVELAATGVNLNMAPVVDLDAADSPAIGHFGRAFSADPAIVATYAEVFIEAFEAAGIVCAAKHFPGEGRAHDDGHVDLPDITATWSELELEPYRRLIASNRLRVVMCGHLRLGTIEKEPIPTSLSKAVITGLLREKLGFRGVVMTDALDMAALGSDMTPREVVIRAIAAGNDIVMAGNTNEFDPLLPQKIVGWVEDAIAAGELTEARIAESADRIRKLKSSLG